MRPLMKSLHAKTVLLAVTASLSVSLAACGGTRNTPDAGPVVDTSCGIDCALQEEYGLIVNRCFEYSDDNAVASPPDLGIAIERVVELEGGQQAIRAVYYQQGLLVLEDSYILANGALKLARRSDETGRSVTYTDDAGAIQGVTLVEAGLTTGPNDSEAVTAVLSLGDLQEATQWTWNTPPVTLNEKTAPLGTFEEAVTISYNETPGHAMDPRLVFVRGTGFLMRSTRLSLEQSDPALPYKLQTVRDLTTETLTTCGSAS